MAYYPNPSGSPSHPQIPLSPSSVNNMNSNLNDGQPPMRCGYDQQSQAVWWCSFRMKRPLAERPANEPDHSAFAGRLMSILDDDHATVRQKLQAKKTQIALNSSEAFQRIVLVTKPLRKDRTMSMRQNMREVISRTTRNNTPAARPSKTNLRRATIRFRPNRFVGYG